MAAVVVFAEDQLAVAAGDGIGEFVAVAAPFEYRRGYAEVGHCAAGRIVAEHLGHLLAAKAEQTAVESDRHGSHWGQRGRSERPAEALFFVEREELPLLVRSEQEPVARVPGPDQRKIPRTRAQRHPVPTQGARLPLKTPQKAHP